MGPKPGTVLYQEPVISKASTSNKVHSVMGNLEKSWNLNDWYNCIFCNKHPAVLKFFVGGGRCLLEVPFSVKNIQKIQISEEYLLPSAYIPTILIKHCQMIFRHQSV